MATIQIATISVWPNRQAGLPRKHANCAARTANQSSPKIGTRWVCARWKREDDDFSTPAFVPGVAVGGAVDTQGDAQGGLRVSEDGNGTIWRVTYVAK